jgi:aspartate kinase
MKFGGTSMGSAERMRVAADIISAQQKNQPVLVVVSAMSRVTDLLLETLKRAELGDRASVDHNIRALLERHVDACRDLLGSSSGQNQSTSAIETLESLVAEFQRIANGVFMLGERPPRSVDEAVAIGERLSCVLLANYLECIGIAAQAVNGSDIIVTDAIFGNASPQMEATRAKCRERILPLITSYIVPVVTGFNGATADGRPTTLGRGGRGP